MPRVREVRAFDVVVPTVGRPSLRVLLDSLQRHESVVERVIVVDDGPLDGPPLDLAGLAAGAGRLPVRVLRSFGRGPAAARNLGWRAARSEWVVFLDDDVVPGHDWSEKLVTDLMAAEHDPGVVASQGRIVVPLPESRRPTDWERNVAGLEHARWPTADMAVRRSALAQVGGFDEAFPRAYREDADLALRLQSSGGRLVVGSRSVTHPVGPAHWLASVRKQAGNADDATMGHRHGRGWRERAQVPRGAFPLHVAATTALVAGAGLLVASRRRGAVASMGIWAVATAGFAARRIAPGPRTIDEAAVMVVTSILIPPVAVWHRLAGEWRARRRGRVLAAAVALFDRDGTLVVDLPYNGDPDRVVPVAGAADALADLRRAGVRVGVVSNQSGVARGLIGSDDVDAVNRRLDELLGPFDTIVVCPHGPEDRCGCRKPQPGLIDRAAAALGVEPAACVVVGDIGADVEAAVAAGARAVLVPTAVTRPAEVRAARANPPDRVVVAPDLATACAHVLDRWR